MKKTRSKSVLATLFLLLIWTAPVAHAAPIPMWELEKPQGSAWILGSIHAMKSDMYPLPGVVTDKVLAVDSLVVEVNVLELEAENYQRVVQETAFYQPGSDKTLLKDLESQVAQLFENYLIRKQIPIQVFEQMKPWFVNITIGMGEIMAKGYDPGLGVDLTLMKMARASGVAIVELESFGQQMELLSADSLAIQNLSLKYTLENIDSIEKDLTELVEAWKKGDVEGMYKAGLNEMEKYPALKDQFDRLIIRRNQAMAEKIETLLVTGDDLMIVVGALHLGGEQGLLRLLGQKYKITQLAN